MKKPRRSSPYDEQPDPMRDLDLDLEDQDDEIIDLEDIIEMPSRSIDEDEDLDLDVEILDADSDLDLESHDEPAGKHRKSYMRGAAETGASEDDILKSLDESEEDESLFETVSSREPSRKPMEKEPAEAFDGFDQSLLDDLMDESEIAETIRSEERVELRERAVSALKVVEETRSARQEAPIASDEFEPPPPPKPVPVIPAPIAPPVDLSRTADELIGRIESRLQEHMRQMVEAMLPDMVRSIISEEIEKLKNEKQ